MIRAISFGAMAIAFGWTVEALPQEAERNVSEIFAKHNCCGRLAHSEIEEIGEVSSGGDTFTIYNLWFENPQSRHGMRHLAVVREGKFVGSYIISSMAVPTVRDNRIQFTCGDGEPCYGEDFVIENGRLPARLWVDGEANILEDTI